VPGGQDGWVNIYRINTRHLKPVAQASYALKSSPLTRLRSYPNFCASDVVFASKSRPPSPPHDPSDNANRCPFEAIAIINLPTNLETQVTHRYTANAFKLHRLPTPRPGQVLGLVGTNGIGKSTALKILSGKLKPNLGRFDVCLSIFLVSLFLP
jgi:ABC-type multidrug transport system fused ATPase/permease subunit